MQLCNETITVFNALLDGETGCEKYYGTVIRGVSWYSETASTVDSSGLKAANKTTIRIPFDADFSGKKYVSPLDYRRQRDPVTLFTLTSGTIIVQGEATEDSVTPADLKKQYNGFVTVLGVTDNRRATHSKHFRVVGS